MPIAPELVVPVASVPVLREAVWAEPVGPVLTQPEPAWEESAWLERVRQVVVSSEPVQRHA